MMMMLLNSPLAQLKNIWAMFPANPTSQEGLQPQALCKPMWKKNIGIPTKTIISNHSFYLSPLFQFPLSNDLICISF